MIFFWQFINMIVARLMSWLLWLCPKPLYISQGIAEATQSILEGNLFFPDRVSWLTGFSCGPTSAISTVTPSPRGSLWCCSLSFHPLYCLGFGFGFSQNLGHNSLLAAGHGESSLETQGTGMAVLATVPSEGKWRGKLKQQHLSTSSL